MTNKNDESFELLVPHTGKLTRNAWEFPAKLSQEDWLEAGKSLTRVDDAYNWWLGDWWAYGSAKYGEKTELLESADWNGPSYETCKAAGWICSTFEMVRRRTNVPFYHYKEIAALPSDEQERLLDWCEEKHRDDGRVPTVKALRERVRDIKAWLAQGWTQSQLDRKALVVDGFAVVASKRKGDDGKETDAALMAWADQQGLLVLVDRTTEWGNPFEMGKDGDRDTVCVNYAEHYLPHKPSLQKNLHTLRGKVLVCWCYPERCHADTLSTLTDGG